MSCEGDGPECGGNTLDDDALFCVLECLPYGETLAMCACLSKAILPVARKLASVARKNAIEAGGGQIHIIDEEVSNRFEGGSVGSQWAEWTVWRQGEDDARYMWMEDCESFVSANFPDSVRALTHLPVFKGDVRQSIRAAATFSVIPEDLNSPSFYLTGIRAKMSTRDPDLQLSLSGVLQANLPYMLEVLDEEADRHFTGTFKCHARFVRWRLIAVLPTE